MPRKDDVVRLYHMYQAACEALGYVNGRERQDLEKNRPLTHSLVRCLEIIGEAANNITPEFRNANPQIAWIDMIGMRNRLIHAYFDVDLNIVWKTVNEELSPLIAALKPILSQEGLI
jgi:uncharacterized protein with HEPN domain